MRNHFLGRLSCSIFLFQALPRSCASGSAALSASGGERRREEDSVRVLVLLHPRLSHWGTAASYSPHNYTEGPLAKGTTYPHSCYESPRHMWLQHRFLFPHRCARVRFRCCQPCWTAPVSSLPWLKIRRLLVHLTPLSPSCWPLPSESCTALSVWLCWLRPPLRLSHRS